MYSGSSSRYSLGSAIKYFSRCYHLHLYGFLPRVNSVVSVLASKYTFFHFFYFPFHTWVSTIPIFSLEITITITTKATFAWQKFSLMLGSLLQRHGIVLLIRRDTFLSLANRIESWEIWAVYFFYLNGRQVNFLPRSYRFDLYDLHKLLRSIRSRSGPG